MHNQLENEDFDEVESPMGWDEYFMRQVYHIASKSKDPRTRVGAVLVRDNQPINSGYNGFPRRVLDLAERYNNQELKYRFISHAENNAVLTAAKRGVCTDGCTLYTLGMPCEICTIALLQGGIREVVYHKQWPYPHLHKWEDSMKISTIMLQEADVKVRKYDKFLNVETLLDGKIITV